jgi:2-methylaconitate isomerase
VSRHRIPAVFIRGGTSKGVFFHDRDLPAPGMERDSVFLNVIGSPDPYQRQLNGMGGGISSLSKAVIIEPSKRDDADIDFTFAQVAVDRPEVVYTNTCGNLSSAVGPFAVDEGLVEPVDGEVLVRVFNTNTSKIYHARFNAEDGQAVETGSFEIPGVAGTGAKIKLDFLDPGGAITGNLLPSGATVDELTVPGLGRVEASFIDATNAIIFIDAKVVGRDATEQPDALEADKAFMAKLDEIRRLGGVQMGMAGRPEDVGLGSPKIALVAAPKEFKTLTGETIHPDQHDIMVRVVSMGRIHRAVTLTTSMCLATACQIEGSIPHRMATSQRDAIGTRIGNPSGVLPVQADVGRLKDGTWYAEHVTVYRTQRRLMEGWVYPA